MSKNGGMIILCGSLLLSGCLPIAAGTTATGSAILAQERSVGAAVDDLTIWTKIKNDMLRTDFDNLFVAVDVKVIEGRVLLAGNVPTQEGRLKAVQIAWDQSGVKEVMNEIVVDEPRGAKAIKDYTTDSWITTQIKTKLLFNQDIRSINYSIETIRAIVYIMGIARDQDELDAVIDIARNVRGVERVVSYVRLKQSMPHSAAVAESGGGIQETSLAPLTPAPMSTSSPMIYDTPAPIPLTQ
jgi:osmotically-inducible protein OsmY